MFENRIRTTHLVLEVQGFGLNAEDVLFMHNSLSIRPVVTGLIMACLAGWGNTADATPMFYVQLQGSACTDGPAFSSTPITRSLTGCQSSTHPSVLFTETMSASADYTSLKGFVDLLVQISDATSVGAVSAVNAGWSDSVIVTGGTGPGTLRMSYTVTGQVIQGFGEARLQLNGNGTQVFSGPGTYVMDVPMVFGVPVNIAAALTVSARPTDLLAIGGPGAFHSIVDFSHTAALLPFVVLDQNLQVLSGASVTSSDLSFNYPVNQAAGAVPEPSTFPMSLAPLTLLGVLRCKRG